MYSYLGLFRKKNFTESLLTWHAYLAFFIFLSSKFFISQFLLVQQNRPILRCKGMKMSSPNLHSSLGNCEGDIVRTCKYFSPFTGSHLCIICVFCFHNFVCMVKFYLFLKDTSSAEHLGWRWILLVLHEFLGTTFRKCIAWLPFIIVRTVLIFLLLNWVRIMPFFSVTFKLWLFQV